MSRKIRPNVFLKAAKFLQRELDEADTSDSPWLDGTCCCLLLVDGTPEYILFKKLFCKKRSKRSYWFGHPDKLTIVDDVVVSSRPHPKNQLKRVNALKKAYKIAKRLK